MLTSHPKPVHDYRLAPNVHVVRGDFEESTSFPESKVVQIGQFRVGLTHGHQIVPWGDPNALAMAQRQLGADILVSGHTHRNQVIMPPFDLSLFPSLSHNNMSMFQRCCCGTRQDSRMTFFMICFMCRSLLKYFCCGRQDLRGSSFPEPPAFTLFSLFFFPCCSVPPLCDHRLV